MRYRATLAYDGTAYHGFQRQAGNTPTIQSAVEGAIARITQQAVSVVAAGRTDTGVHAEGQVIAFDVVWRHPDADLLRAINAVLPDDIALQDLCQQPGFHPRYDAVSRCYRYTVLQSEQRQPLLRGRVWWQNTYTYLDLSAMKSAADLLVGKHDFATFGHPPQGTNTVRELFVSKWTERIEGQRRFLIYEIDGTAFLHHMVRRIVGMTVDVGRGTLAPDEFKAAFQAADIGQSGTVAPPQGLVLQAVHYAETQPQLESGDIQNVNEEHGRGVWTPAGGTDEQ